MNTKKLILKTIIIVVTAIVTILVIRIALMFFIRNSVEQPSEEEQHLKSEFRDK